MPSLAVSVGSVRNMSAPVISIDGPVGSGKTTVGRVVADRHGFFCLDSGLFYRAAALVVLRSKIDLSDVRKVLGLVKSLELKFISDGNSSDGIRVLHCGQDITPVIHSSAVDSIVSDVSRAPEVRTHLVNAQRSFIRQGGVVAIGRDIGTVVWPQAELKIYLTASLEARANRKWIQRREAGEAIEAEEVRTLLESRDHMDSTRAHAPLMAAEDAVRIDSSYSRPFEIADAIDKLLRERNLVREA